MSTFRFQLRPRGAAMAALVAALLLCAAFAGSASAAGSASLSSDASTLTFTGSSSEGSNLRVTYASFAFVLEEPTLSITAGTGCTQTTSKKVTCPTTATSSVLLNMGGGGSGDAVDMSDTYSPAGIPPYVTTTVNDVNTVYGGDGPMIINAGPGNIYGGSSYDIITIDAGSEVMQGNINGGAKDDLITIENSAAWGEEEESIWGKWAYSVSGGDGEDLIDASDSTTPFRYEASGGRDVLLGSSAGDEVDFGSKDLIFGNGGDDRFYDKGEATSDPAELWGGAGNDTFTDLYPDIAEPTHFEGGPGIDRVTYASTSSYDVRVSIDGDPTTNDGVVQPGGGTDNDHIHLSVENVGNYSQLSSQMEGNDEIIGSALANQLYGHGGNDSIEGAEGNDRLDGAGGNDEILGGDGNDNITDRSGANTLLGDGGDDSIVPSPGDDVIDGGTGTDTLSYAGANISSGVTINLGTTSQQNSGGAGLETIAGFEKLTGSAYADTLTGSSAANTLNAGSGNDTVNATDGVVDTIICGPGTDTVDADAIDSFPDSSCENVTLH